MPGRVYSHRFISTNNHLAWTYWTCPVGYVAVVKAIASANTSGASGNRTLCAVAGQMVLVWQTPGANTYSSTQTHQVFYPGETVQATVDLPQMSCVVSGYLLEEYGERPAADQGLMRKLTAQQLPGPEHIIDLVELRERT